MRGRGIFPTTEVRRLRCRILGKRRRDFELDLEGEREFLAAVRGENDLIEPHNVFDHVQVVDNIFYTSEEREE